MPPDTMLILTATLLRRGRSLDGLSAAVSLIALLAGLFGHGLPGVVVLAIVVLGLVQKYWALRVAVDAELFAYFANQPDRAGELDAALIELSLARDPLVERTWLQRSRAALALLRRQVCWLIVQLVVAVGYILLADISSAIFF